MERIKKELHLERLKSIYGINLRNYLLSKIEEYEREWDEVHEEQTRMLKSIADRDIDSMLLKSQLSDMYELRKSIIKECINYYIDLLNLLSST